MDRDVNDAIEKEFDGDNGNNSKLQLLEWNQSNQDKKDGIVNANDFYGFDSNTEFPPPWFVEIMFANRTKRLSDKFEFRKLLAEIDHEFGLDNSSQDSLEFSNDVDLDDVIFDDVDFQQGMDDVYFEQDIDELLYYGPNKVDFKQGMKEILYYDTNDGASISGKSGIEDEVEPLDIEMADLLASKSSGVRYDSFVIYDQLIDYERDVVLVEVLSKELVARDSFDGDDGEQVVLDGDVILDEVYDAMVAQKEVLSASDGGVIPTEVYDAMVAQDMLAKDDGDVILVGRLSTLFKLEGGWDVKPSGFEGVAVEKEEEKKCVKMGGKHCVGHSVLNTSVTRE
nr:hypothetical protein [Tanacetum cinerariifolium]